MGECICGMSLRTSVEELSVGTWIRSTSSGIDSTGLKVVIDGDRVPSLMLEVEDDFGLELFVESYARIGAYGRMLNLKGDTSSSSSSTGKHLAGRELMIF